LVRRVRGCGCAGQWRCVLTLVCCRLGNVLCGGSTVVLRLCRDGLVTLHQAYPNSTVLKMPNPISLLQIKCGIAGSCRYLLFEGSHFGEEGWFKGIFTRESLMLFEFKRNPTASQLCRIRLPDIEHLITRVLEGFVGRVNGGVSCGERGGGGLRGGLGGEDGGVGKGRCSLWWWLLVVV
jgi:hypothetical protein